jgi:hypothetical protein
LASPPLLQLFFLHLWRWQWSTLLSSFICGPGFLSLLIVDWALGGIVKLLVSRKGWLIDTEIENRPRYLAATKGIG